MQCTVKAKGLIMIRQTADDWDKALDWARAIVVDPPERPATRTRYQVDGDEAPGGGG